MTQEERKVRRRKKVVPGKKRGRKKGLASSSLQIIRELQAGTKQTDIAKKFGVTKQRISQIRLVALHADML